MICLDTNYLIGALVAGSPESVRIAEWIHGHEPIILPAVAWYEFLCGSSTEEERLASALVTHGVRPFGENEARQSARLFKLLNKPRALRVDAMIAGTAMAASARLATNNRGDFKRFVSFGLLLV
jgi:predicted nucleic acid-binding protein